MTIVKSITNTVYLFNIINPFLELATEISETMSRPKLLTGSGALKGT